jgi:ketol-acid reductoisomerase
MTVIYSEGDVNPGALGGQPIAVLGYGNVGRSMALNLRDSGQPVVIGNADDEYAPIARADGFNVLDLATAAGQAAIKLLTLPDEIMPELYLTIVSPGLKAGDALVFTSAYNVAFGYIEPPPFVDVLLLAPRTSGIGIREAFLAGRGFASFVAVSQEATGKAWDRLLALGAAVGALRIGALEITFQQEAELDLFIQQTVLPALLNLLITAADLLIKEGYPPEAVLMDLYGSGELSLLLDKAAQHGLQNSLEFLSQTAQYGILSRIERFLDQNLRRKMETALGEIRGSNFAHEWASEYANGYPRLDAIRRRRSSMALWEAEQQMLSAFGRTPPDSEDDGSA